MISFVKDIDHYKLIWSHSDVKIDTLVSSLHYRVTVILLLIFFGVVCNQQYFGEPIECIQDVNSDASSVPMRVMNNFCFVSSTYTILRSTGNAQPLENLGSDFETSYGSEVRHHAYYQWVPLVLLLQAVLFRLPHIGWEHWEGGLLQGLTSNLKGRQKLKMLAKYFTRRINTHQVWLSGFILYEIFSFLNLTGNILMTNYLLSGYFLPYGVQIMRYLFGSHLKIFGIDFSGYKNPTDILFPKMTKCSFYKYGPSGTIQRHDSMCIMTLNVVNEKIFAVLWFWYLILLVVSCLNVLWRLLSFFIVFCLSGSESGSKNKIVLFALRLPAVKEPYFHTFVSKKFFYSDWMMLSFLSNNLPSSSYFKLIDEITVLCKDD